MSFQLYLSVALDLPATQRLVLSAYWKSVLTQSETKLGFPKGQCPP